MQTVKKSFFKFWLFFLFLAFGGLVFARMIKAVSPTASPSATPIDDEKIREIRDKVKEKVNEIREKIEKKAYVGKIVQITDSTLTLENFRGKQRVRISEETVTVGANKKEIKSNELALEERIIAIGTVGENDILEASRVVVVPKPKITPPKRLVFWGTISGVDSKKSSVTLTAAKNSPEVLTLKVNQETLKLAGLKKGQKALAVYPEPAEGKIPTAKTLFILP